LPEIKPHPLPLDCLCMHIYAPVCGINGQTYSNYCEAECAGQEISCSGECPCTATTKQISMTADNEYTLYAGAPGIFLPLFIGTGHDWTQTEQFSVAASSPYLLVIVKDLHVVGGILLSASDGTVTDSSWMCRLEAPGAQWEPAKEIGTNGVAPWFTRPNIASHAKWIWVTDDGNPPAGVSHPYSVACSKSL